MEGASFWCKSSDHTSVDLKGRRRKGKKGKRERKKERKRGADLEVFLDLARIRGGGGGSHVETDGDAGTVVGLLVHVGEQYGGADGRLVVDAGAAIAMAAGPDLEVEGAVNAVLLRAEYGSQVLRHS